MRQASKKLPFISVITVNWNGERFLKKLLPILQKQTYPKDRFEIIVLDNNSTRDNSVAFVSKHFPDVQLIQNSENDGFARGSNLAMQAAKGEYFVIINNDTQPKPDWLAKLVDCAVRTKSGAVVPKVLFANRGGGHIINNAGSILYPNRTWPVEELGANQKDGPEFNKEREITAICGTSPLFSRKMLEDIGLFDEQFFMYFEDSDLSWRGQKAHWKFYYTPESVVLHEHSASSVEHSDFWTFYVTRNRLLILCKHAPFHVAGKAYTKFVFEFIAAPIINGLRGRQRRHQLHQLKLGNKIAWSFFLKLWPTLLKRMHLMREAQL